MLLLWITLLFVTRTCAQNTYYVSTSKGTPLGSGQNILNACSNLTRLLDSVPSGSTILLCQGDVFTGPFRVSKQNITFSSYRCSEETRPPTLTAAVKLSTRPNRQTMANGLSLWTFSLSSIMTTSASRVWAVWVGNDRMLPARFPNLVDPRVTYGQSASEFSFSTSTWNNTVSVQTLRNMSSNYWVGATLRLRDSEWSYDRSIITQVWRNVLFFREGIIDAATSSPRGFFLEHGLSELDARGEYFYNATTKTLHMIPIVDDTSLEVFVLSGGQPEPWRLSHISEHADISSILTITGGGFNISNILISHGFSGVNVTAPNVSFTNVNFQRFISRGVRVSSNGGFIDNCAFSEIDQYAVQAERFLFRVTSSRFDDIGLLAGYNFQPSAIHGVVSVFNCTFNNMGYSAILPHSGGVAADNTITNYMMAFGDGSAIYSWGNTTKDIQVLRNHITKARPNGLSFGKTWPRVAAIYGDDCSSSWTIQDNYIELDLNDGRPEVDKVGIQLLNSFNNRVSGNTLVNAVVRLIHSNTGFEQFGMWCEPEFNDIENNRFSSSDGKQNVFVSVEYWNLKIQPSSSVISNFRGNTFCRNRTSFSPWNPVFGLQISMSDNFLFSNQTCNWPWDPLSRTPVISSSIPKLASLILNLLAKTVASFGTTHEEKFATEGATMAEENNNPDENAPLISLTSIGLLVGFLTVSAVFMATVTILMLKRRKERYQRESTLANTSALFHSSNQALTTRPIAGVAEANLRNSYQDVRFHTAQKSFQKSYWSGNR